MEILKNNFVNAVKDLCDSKFTDNGAFAYSTTGSKVLNLFCLIGTMRQLSEGEIIEKYLAARAEDKELTDNIILYARNIRDGGLGERKISRIMLKELATIDPSKVARNIDTIVKAGRWDDIYALENTPCDYLIWKTIKKQLNSDLINLRNNQPISLLAKWLPSINASSKETKRLGKKTALMIGYTEKQYRKVLSKLRNYLRIVERQMSAQQWQDINFELVPSLAMLRYTSAFEKKCANEFQQYQEDLKNQKTSIKTTGLYPYNILERFFDGDKWSNIYEEQWKGLPNFINNDIQAIVMADVSGSMYTKPMASSVGLGIYFAEHNQGAYHNLLMTFSENPRFINLDGLDTLYDKCNHILQPQYIGYNTNLDRGFEAIFNIAKDTHEVPKSLIVISDMEIDAYCQRYSCEDIVNKWVTAFNEIGLQMPKLILWNVQSTFSDTVLSKAGNPYISYCSGYSISTFQYLTTLIDKGAMDSMRDILSQPQFQWK